MNKLHHKKQRSNPSLGLFVSLLMIVASIGSVNAQNFGYIHRDSILKSVPNYLPKLQELSDNQKKYSAEISQGMENLQQKVSKLLQHLPAGVYMATLQTDGIQKHVRIVKY